MSRWNLAARSFRRQGMEIKLSKIESLVADFAVHAFTAKVAGPLHQAGSAADCGGGGLGEADEDVGGIGARVRVSLPAD